MSPIKRQRNNLEAPKTTFKQIQRTSIVIDSDLTRGMRESTARAAAAGTHYGAERSFESKSRKVEIWDPFPAESVCHLPLYVPFRRLADLEGVSSKTRAEARWAMPGRRPEWKPCWRLRKLENMRVRGRTRRAQRLRYVRNIM